MAKARALDKRRKSIRNIRKITRTMELVARASFSRAMSRAVAASAYTRRITALVGHLIRSGLEVTHPLLEPHDDRSGFGALLAVAVLPGMIYSARRKFWQPLVCFILPLVFMLPAWWFMTMHEPRFFLWLAGLSLAALDVAYGRELAYCGP